MRGTYYGFTNAAYVFGPNGSFENSRVFVSLTVTPNIHTVQPDRLVQNYIDSGYTWLAFWGTLSCRTNNWARGRTAKVSIQISHFSPTGSSQYSYQMVGGTITLTQNTTSWQSMNIRKLFTSAADVTLRRMFEIIVHVRGSHNDDGVMISVKVENFNVAFVKP